MSTYPPNNTTPKSPSGNYLWNWLGSPLKKFAAALAPYLGDGYSYKEFNISAADIINPQPTAGGIGLGTGIVLLDNIPPNSYYEWKLNLEFTPGSLPYTATINEQMMLLSGYMRWPSMSTGGSIGNNLPFIWFADSRSILQINAGYDVVTYADLLEGPPINSYSIPCLQLQWSAGNYFGGDGTMKVKLWYKVVNFG